MKVLILKQDIPSHENSQEHLSYFFGGKPQILQNNPCVCSVQSNVFSGALYKRSLFCLLCRLGVVVVIMVMLFSRAVHEGLRRKSEKVAADVQVNTEW